MCLKKLKKYRNDIILITCIILLSFSSWFIMDALKTEGDYVVVKLNREEYARYPLNKDAEIRIENGEEYNILQIKNGKARVIDASCPDKHCVKQGAISYSLQVPLTCKPNRVTVTVVSDKTPEIDFVS